MQLARVLSAAGSILALCLLGGCADDGLATVDGTVNLDGQPVAEGSIQFVPMDGKTQTAGAAIKDGRYSARVPVTNMKVSLSAPKVIGKKKLYDTPDSPEMPITAEALPAKYNEKTELQFEVKPGVNQKDFELLSK